MVAPTTFTSPSSGSTVSPSGKSHVSHVNGLWVAATDGTSSAQPVVRYASDPTGVWSTATALPSPPTGYTNVRSVVGDPVYADGEYHIAVGYKKSGAFAYDTNTYRIYSAASLSGSWTETNPGLNDYREWGWFTYANGEYILSGGEIWAVSVFDPWPWKIAHCATVGGSWVTETGPTDVSSGISAFIMYAGGTYYHVLRAWTGDNSVQWSSSLSGTWSYSTAPAARMQGQIVLVGSTFVLPLDDGSLIHSDDLSGAWSSATLPAGFTASWVVHDGTWFVVGGTTSGGPTVIYGTSLSSFDYATDAFTSAPVMAGAHADGYFVMGDNGGKLNCSNMTITPATGPTYLRLHQSPVYAPSRVRGIDLRQRQTPIITK